MAKLSSKEYSNKHRPCVEGQEYLCLCGCNNKIEIKKHYKWYGVPDFINGHNGKFFKPTEEHKQKLSKERKGVPRSADLIDRLPELIRKGMEAPEVREKCAAAKRGKPSYIRTDAHKQSMSEIKLENNPWKGCHHTEETKKLFSEQRRGENSPNYGKVWSEEEKAKASSLKKELFAKGILIPTMLGRHHKDETKQQQSLRMMGNKFSLGKKHTDSTKELQSKKAAERIVKNNGINPTWRHCKKGYYCSEKNQKEIYYSSSYELQAFKILEQLSKVKAYDRCSYYIEYEFEDKVKNYIPDILVTYSDDTKEIIEIKPENLLNDGKNRAKFAAGLGFCEANNIKYSVWTEQDLNL